jgi:hypothetical protein
VAYIGNPVYQTAFVTDQFSGTGSQTAYTMSVAPANTASVLVSVHGVVQDPSTYAVLGNSLTFSQAPPSGTGNISCRYLGIPANAVVSTAYRTVTDFTATVGQTVFSVPSYTVGYIDVYRNGVKLGQADYTASSGTTVVLNNACSAGDLVETVSFYVSSVLNAIPAVAGAVNSNYLATGAVTQSILASGVAGNGPAFSVYLNASQTFSSGAYTKVAFNTKEIDTANCFDNVTNYRFTPTVSGYYEFNVWLNSANSASSRWIAWLYKNGSQYKVIADNNTTSPNCLTCSTVFGYANGSTDFYEVYTYVSGTSPGVFGNSNLTISSRFEGFLARST